MAPPPLRFFATCPRGLSDLLAGELRALGASAVREHPAGASFRGDLATGYRACLWSRTASRVLLTLLRIEVEDADGLYQGVYEVPWEEHMSVDGTLAVDAVGTGAGIHHGRFAAQKVKDAVVDRFRRESGRRPSVAPERPDLRLHLHLEGPHATLSLDLAGEALHRRGYRVSGVEAPVKENLAAGLLLRAGWPAVAARGGTLVDPMCGSGTLPIEAALMATDTAPGLRRAYWGFLGWRGHSPGTWDALLEEARGRARAGAHGGPSIVGYDADTRAIAAADANARAAGVAERVRFETRAVEALGAPSVPPGLLVVNPPYGERLGQPATLIGLYQTLGLRLRQAFAGWQAAVLTADETLARALGLSPQRRHRLWNGPIECQLLRFDLDLARPGREHPAPRSESPPSPGASMLVNRLRKNLATLGRWARRQGIGCYRLYDADMPEYAVAVDLYHGADLRVHVQEYAPPATVDPGAAARRLEQVMAVLPGLLEVPRAHLYLKVRRRQRPGAQYPRLGARGELFTVAEGPCRFLVNLTDYLDTGLFLDHRETRRLLAGLAAGGRFLNLFAYTATATVCAAHGGAVETTSVDLSPTYLGWARRNLDLNGIGGPRHRLVQADCLDWLEREAAAAGHRPRYDLVFIDPPTFSNSKRMRGTLDVQRDHVRLLGLAARLLTPGGTLLFSTHLRGFRLDREALAELDPEDLSARTIPRDFERSPRIHQCWRLRVR
jgi:23S rRNA (guanine2445-N2)-methyltransferase / 23S rRNA (guanine2069-N7)-methyltransferase